MAHIEDLLGSLSKAEVDASFRVELLDPKRPAELRRLELLLETDGVRVSDTLTEQLAELVQVRSPAAVLGQADVERLVREQLGGPAWAYGCWAFYAWDARLVHVLPEAEHFELRTDRNRHKITSDEQLRLRRLRIGVIGLSSGQAVVLALAQEGIGGLFRLADFDRLSLSNMNRVRGRVHEVGLSKAVMTARAIAEMDPFLKVEIFPAGFDAQSADAFFDDGAEQLDFLIEACDAIDIKALARVHARKRRVPVLMANSEGGILDVERFDREPERPIFHGLAPAEIDPTALSGADIDTKAAFLLPIVGLDNLSDRMIASLVEVGSTVSTWPQLASGVALGAALVTSTLRRVALGELHDSGRYVVGLESSITDGQRSAASAPDAGVGAPRAEPEVVAEGDVLRAIVRAALAAPSGGNAQPCRFVRDGNRIEVYRREGAAVPAFDPDDDSALIAAGAAVENAVLSARSYGFSTSIDLDHTAMRGRASPLVRLTFTSVAEDDDPLVAFIDRRCTNRKRAEASALARADLDMLRAAATERGALLEVIEDAQRLALLAELVGTADRLRMLSEPMLRDLAGELRWTAEEVARTRDGLDVRALELRAGELASLRMMLRPSAMSFLRSIRGGARIRRMAREGIMQSPAVGLITCEGAGSEVFFRGGRAIERVWLRATERGLALAPMTALLFLMRLATRGDGLLDPDQLSEIGALKRAFDGAFPRPPASVHVFLFRLGRASTPTVTSLRRPLADMLAVRS